MEIQSWQLNPKTIVIDGRITGVNGVLGMGRIVTFGGININKDDAVEFGEEHGAISIRL